MVYRLISLVVVAVVVVCLQRSLAQADGGVIPPETPAGIRSYPPEMPGAEVQVYKRAGDVALNAYVFNPVGHAPGDKRPAVVFFFGGGWRAGTPGQFYAHCRYLAKRGLVAMTMDYRVLNRHGVPASVCVSDAKSAIRWVRTNAKRLGVDPNRIVASGGSAGGHLAAATALVPNLDEPAEDHDVASTPNALVLFNPAVQLAPFADLKPFDETKLADINERAGGDAVAISPIHHVRKGLPPTIIFHGTSDQVVPHVTVERFTKEMTKAGNRCQLISFEGQRHGFFNPGRGGAKKSKSAAVANYRETMRHCDQFLISLRYLSPRPSSEVPDSIESKLDVVYARNGDRAMRMDLFYPKRRSQELLPAILVVHGGGWLNGDKEKFRPLAIELASRGFVTAAVEYRLGGESRFPAAIHDCNAAVRHLRAHAKALGVDPERIGAVGGSAGGHLVGLMAAAAQVESLQGEGGNQDYSSRLQSAIVLAGPLELAAGPVADRSRQEPQKSNANKWFGKTVDEAPELYKLASATTHLSEQCPPILFMAGEFDKPERNLETRRKLMSLGVETGIVVVRGGKHGCWNRHPFFLPMIDEMHLFFGRTLP
jgi:acetyl esterase/lipase